LPAYVQDTTDADKVKRSLARHKNTATQAVRNAIKLTGTANAL